MEIIIVVSYCFCNPLTSHMIQTRYPILIGFSAKYNLAMCVCNQVGKLKLNLLKFRLILLDHTQGNLRGESGLFFTPVLTLLNGTHIGGHVWR